MKKLITLCALTIAVAGCRTTDVPEPVVDASASMEFLEAGLRPEVLLFPEYLLMEDFELSRHGRVPETRLIGAGMKTELGLSATRRRFSDELDARGWRVDKTEIEKNAVRLMATRAGDRLEIRAVRGTKSTRVFLLYEPSLENTPLEL